jgi:hypothetical protein
MLLKMDVARAFDSVAWPFLVSVLRQHAFGPRFVVWIMLLLRTSSTRVLVNGSPGSAFYHGCGLRQGDPISPMLFIIAMDVMPLPFRVVEERGALADLRPHRIRHLLISLYANDVVIFARPGPDELRAVRLVLATFSGASVLQLNYAKSLALPIRCSHEVCDGAAAALACPIGPFLSTTSDCHCPSPSCGSRMCSRSSTN